MPAPKAKPKIIETPNQPTGIHQYGGIPLTTNSRIIPAGVTVPPPPVLWHWLSYIYQTTGEWWLPPSIATNTSASNDYNSGHNQLPKVTTHKESSSTRSNLVQISQHTSQAPKSILHHSRNLPGSYSSEDVTDKPKARTHQEVLDVSERKEDRERDERIEEDFPTSTFNYTNSIYFSIACQLIEKYAPRTINEQISQQFSFKAAKVLAFIVAWSQHPFFTHSSANSSEPHSLPFALSYYANREDELAQAEEVVPGETGYWMTLSRQRCAKELGMRPADFIEICGWLEAIGILQVGDLLSGIINHQTYERFCQIVQFASTEQLPVRDYWPLRSLHNKIKVYRIAIALPENVTLPAFMSGFDQEVSLHNIEIAKSFNEPGVSKEIGKALPVVAQDTSEIGKTKKVESHLAIKTYSQNNEAIRPKLVTGNSSLGESVLVEAGDEASKAFPENCSTKWERFPYDHDWFSNSKYVTNKVIKTENHESHGIRKVFPDPLTRVSFPEVHTLSDEPDLEASNTDNVSYPPFKREILGWQETAKLDFLKKARFEGFNGAQGRTTLDYKVAVKFARNPRLSLEELREIYNQVLERWRRKELENPVGYFHVSLKNLCSSRKEQPLSSAVRVKTPKKSGQISTNLSLPSRSSQENFECPSLALNQGKSGWEALFNNPDYSCIIWQEVREEDLSSRFRLSIQQLKTLEGSQLIVNREKDLKGSNSAAVIIKLASTLELNSLNYEVRSIIRMALTQRLGSDYSLSFEVGS